MPARDLIDRFGKDEEAFLNTEFVAPVEGEGRVRVRIRSVVVELSVVDPVSGIHVLKPRSTREAGIVRPATRAEAKRYLELFPAARLVVTAKAGELAFGLPASQPGKGIRIEGLVPISIAPGLRLFETVRVRFDGALFLYESSERPAEAQWLREQLFKMASPGALDRKGLTEEERFAYARQFRMKEELMVDAEERRLRRALELAGATLRDFREAAGVFTVTYRVDGATYTSVVRKGDLTVLSSGICLSGRDQDFDLTTLVGVMRQARREGMDEPE